MFSHSRHRLKQRHQGLLGPWARSCRSRPPAPLGTSLGMVGRPCWGLGVEVVVTVRAQVGVEVVVTVRARVWFCWRVFSCGCGRVVSLASSFVPSCGSVVRSSVACCVRSGLHLRSSDLLPQAQLGGTMEARPQRCLPRYRSLPPQSIWGAPPAAALVKNQWKGYGTVSRPL